MLVIFSLSFHILSLSFKNIRPKKKKKKKEYKAQHKRLSSCCYTSKLCIIRVLRKGRQIIKWNLDEAADQKEREKQKSSLFSPKLVASNWLYFTLYLTCQGQSLSFIFLKPQRTLFWTLHGYFKVGKNNRFLWKFMKRKHFSWFPSQNRWLIEGTRFGNIFWKQSGKKWS